MKISNLEANIEIIEEEVRRKLYLRELLTGKIQGPLTNIPNIDMEWLMNYSEDQIMSPLPKKTILGYMKENNLIHLDDIAIIYFNKKISYGEFFKKIDACAASFIKNNIRKGDTVTLCMPGTPETYIAFYALNQIGAIAHMVHPLSSENQIKNYVNEVGSKMIITIDSTYDKVNNIMNQTSIEKVVSVAPNDSMPFPLSRIYPLTKSATKLEDKNGMTSWKDFMKEGEKIDIKNYIADYEKDRISVLLQTGGTTGISKCVGLTDDNFNSMVEQFKANVQNFERGDHMLTVMPPFHGFGLCSSAHLPLSYGVTIVVVPKVDINQIDKMIMKYNINYIIGVPTLFKGMKMVVNKKKNGGKIKKFNLSNLKYAVSGGSLAKNGFEQEIDEFIKENGGTIKLSKGYGLSEAVAGVTFADEAMKNENTVGIPMVHTNIKIVDPETRETLENNQIGEICIKGPSVMEKYYNNPEETEKCLVDGWLHTGDMGYMNKGQLYFSERKGDMIISSGVNVYPNEIEQVIESHKAVSACAVIGIAHPYKEEVPKAFICLKDGYEPTDEINSEIEYLCKQNLDKYSHPSSIEYRDKLPQTLLGKISHAQLRKEEVAKRRCKVYEKK
ncbi:MAG: acyl--CoA ligase [Bacilli bacterium]|nr:acyl--CoA ligase [Bacilli bacterium]